MSIFLHGLLVVLFCMESPSHKRQFLESRGSVSVEIKSKLGLKSKSRPVPIGMLKERTLKDLIGSSTYKRKQNSLNENKEIKQVEGGWKKAPAEFRAKSFMDSYGMDQYVKDMPFYEELWGRVNKNLAYPKDFVEQRLQGFVQVDIMVNEKGQFTGEILKLNTRQKVLGAYVLSLLIVALKKPLINKIAIDSKTIPIALSFKFEYYNSHTDKLEERGGHQKNILHFHRKRYVEPIVSKYLNKIFTRYVPPIISFPGGVYVDLIRLYQFIDNLGSEDPDELRMKRIKLKLKEMNQFIKSSDIVEII